MTIAPVCCSVEVPQPPAAAFHLFAERMIDWWQDGTPGEGKAVTIAVEPHVGGRWFERDADGNETDWGRVKIYRPGEQLLLDWQLNGQFQFDPAIHCEVDIRFTASASGGTTVTLEHRDLESLGSDAPRIAEMIRSGWPKKLQGYATCASAQEETL